MLRFPNRFLFLFILRFSSPLLGTILWEDNSIPTVHVRVETDRIRLFPGETFRLTLSVDHSDSLAFDAESAIARAVRSGNPLEPLFDLVDFSGNSVPAENGFIRSRVTTTLRPGKTGKLFFAFLVLSFIPKNDSVERVDLFPPIFSIEVAPFPRNSETAPIAPLISVAEEFPLGLTLKAERKSEIDELEEEKIQIRSALAGRHFPRQATAIAAGIAGLFLVLYFGRRYFFSGYLSPIAGDSKQNRFDFKASLHRLADMEPADESEKKRYSELYYQTLREGIAEKMKIPVHTMTREEIEKRLNETPLFSPVQKKEILRQLSNGDRFKFQGVVPEEEDFHFLESLFVIDANAKTGE